MELDLIGLLERSAPAPAALGSPIAGMELDLIGLLEQSAPAPAALDSPIAGMELDLIGLLERSAPAPAALDSPAVVEEGGVDVWLELSLGLGFGDVESRKRVREGDEAVKSKKPKMEESLPVMPAAFLWPNGYYYASMMPYWLSSSMQVFGNDVYEPRDNPFLALEMDVVAADDRQVEVAGGSSSPESRNSGTSVLQLFC